MRYLLRSVRSWLLRKRRPISPWPQHGYVWAPYVPLQVTPSIHHPSNFSSKKGILTRYSKKQVQTNYYGTISILPGKKTK